LLLASPLGAGAAFALLPALAKSYGVGAGEIIWVNGIGGGIALTLGAVCGAWLPRHWNRHLTYVLAGLTNAVAAAILFSVQRPEVYFAGTLLYLSTTGLCWARFAALVVSIVGPGVHSVCTKYSVVAALGNIPLLYMMLLDGFVAKHYGIHGLLSTEVGGSLLTALVAALLLISRRVTGQRATAEASLP
jgi:hypothetical protein